MTRIITATVACLFLCGWCIAQAPATKPTMEPLSDAQAREVHRYRSDQRSKQGRSDTELWRTLEVEKHQEGFAWQEPKPAGNGELVEGKWVQVLTPAQLQEVRTWVRKETDLIKERSQLRFERKEAMASGDKRKVGLIDGRLREIKDRVQIPVPASPITQWEAIVKEQSRRGLEWHERPMEKGQESTTGSWERKGQK
jgi:hypothetical protein